MPPPLTPEQYFQLQMQMMATLNNTVQALQQAHTQPPPPPPPQKSLNGVVQGSHHLHLELEVLLRSQWRRHRDPGTLVVLTLLLARTGTGAPGVHHLI